MNATLPICTYNKFNCSSNPFPDVYIFSNIVFESKISTNIKGIYITHMHFSNLLVQRFYWNKFYQSKFKRKVSVPKADRVVMVMYFVCPWNFSIFIKANLIEFGVNLNFIFYLKTSKVDIFVRFSNQ